MIRPKLVQPAFFFKISISAQRRFFFWRSKGVQGETVGNSRRSHLRSAKKDMFLHNFSDIFHEHMLQNNYFFVIVHEKCLKNCVKTYLFCRAKVRSPIVSNRFPLDTFDLQKKNGVARKCLFKKKMRVEQVLAWSCFRPFPTVSDRFRPFHFFWTIYWTTSIYGRLIQCKPVQTMTLKFFGATLVRVHCIKYCILTLISNIP